jgi:hypothetical protein
VTARLQVAKAFHAGAWLCDQVAVLAAILGEDLSVLGGVLEMDLLFPEEPWT